VFYRSATNENDRGEFSTGGIRTADHLFGGYRRIRRVGGVVEMPAALEMSSSIL
jgi:hypothetical protein